MADYTIVGIGLRDVWDYDYVRKWMDREKQKTTIRKAIERIPALKGYEHTPNVEHLWCNSDEILATTLITEHTYGHPAVCIRYDRNTLDYLVDKSSKVIQKLIDIVVSGVQKGLEETIRKQKEFREGKDHHDEGFAYLTEMEKAVTEALNSNEEICSVFSLKERNHMVYYLINKFINMMRGLE